MRGCPRCGSLYTNGADFCGIDGTQTTEAVEDPLVGRVVGGRYRVLERIAMGGVGALYRAQHITLQNEVALKVLFGEMASQPSIAERFRREAQAACRIRHPNVVVTFDFGTDPSGLVYLSMELLRGVNLFREIGEHGALDLKRVRALASQIAAGLAAVHRLGFIHRDIKPSNILLVQEDGIERVKIVDFGLVRLRAEIAPEDRLTQVDAIVGTPHYMAPEVIGGEDGSSAADLYALGVTMFEMLEGRLPYEGTTAELLTQHLNAPIPALPAFDGLGPLVTRLLDKDPETRIPLEEVARRLDEAPPKARKRWPWVATAVALLGLSTVVVWAIGDDHVPPPGRAPVPTRDAPIANVDPPKVETSTPTRSPIAKAPPRRRRKKRVRPPPQAAQPVQIIEVQVTSTPLGATVSTPRGTLGKTPLTAFLPSAPETVLTLSKDGHGSKTVRWTQKNGTRLDIRLEPSP